MDEPYGLDMNLEDLEVGKLYLLRGGHLMRYQGLYAKNGKPKGPGLAFRGVRHHHDPAVPTGYSATKSEILRKVTIDDLSWLEVRRDEARARDLEDHALDAQFALDELTRDAELT